MVRMFVRHQVADYSSWREVYDGIEQDRQEFGVTGHDVFQALGNPNDITVWHDFTSKDAADSFASSPQLRDAMQRAGVQGQPEIWFTTAA